MSTRIVRRDHAGGERSRRAELHDQRDGLRRSRARRTGTAWTSPRRRGWPSGLNLQGGTSTGPRRSRQLRRHARAAGAPRHGTGRFVRRHRKVVDLVPGPRLVHACRRSTCWSAPACGRSRHAPGGGVATNGLSLAANYVVPNTVIAQSLGRLPANALATGTTTVNLLNPGRALHARAHQSGGHALRQDLPLRRHGATDVGIDLYNLFNSNVTTGVSADVQVRDQRRGVAAADGHRGAAAGAVPRDV